MSSPTPRLIELPKIYDPRGSLTFVEGERHVPFPIRRVFVLYDVPEDAERGGHALKTCDQFLVAVAGGLDVHVDDGLNKRTFRLDRPNCGLHLPPLFWRELSHFAAHTVCLALASEPYSEAGYFRTYEAFLAGVGPKA